MKKDELPLKEASHHSYDIELFSILDDLRKKFSDDTVVKIFEDIANTTYINLLEERILTALSKDGVNVPQIVNDRHFIIQSDTYLFLQLLGWKLITISPSKIELLLNHHLSGFKGNYFTEKNNFIGLIEFQVFQFVEANNYAKEDIRLDKITNWVNNTRIEQASKNNHSEQKSLINRELAIEFLIDQSKNFYSIIMQIDTNHNQIENLTDIHLDPVDKLISGIDQIRIKHTIIYLKTIESKEKLFELLSDLFIFEYLKALKRLNGYTQIQLAKYETSQSQKEIQRFLIQTRKVFALLMKIQSDIYKFVEVASKELKSKWNNKGICLAYQYMYMEKIYPIPEIYMVGHKTVFYEKLSNKYNLSFNRFKNNFPSVTHKDNRLSMPQSIAEAIEIMNTFQIENIEKAISRAENELNIAMLK